MKIINVPYLLKVAHVKTTKLVLAWNPILLVSV